MSVKTSDRMLHETVSRRAVVDSPDSQSRVRSAPRPGQDPYPTRLAEPLDMPWLHLAFTATWRAMNSHWKSSLGGSHSSAVRAPFS